MRGEGLWRLAEPEFADTTIRARQSLADCIVGSSRPLSDVRPTETHNCLQLTGGQAGGRRWPRWTDL